MIRILQVVNKMDRAGLETMLMNYYRNIDRAQVQFDFLTHREEDGAYDEEIKSLGGKVYHAPRLYPQNYPAYFKWMDKFFSEHPEYKIVHSHIDAMSAFPLYASKKNNIPVRIAHSHSSKLDKDFKLPIKYAALKFIPKVANVNYACGKVAGEFMYPSQKFRIINNAVDIEKFSFDQNKRKEIQQILDIENKYVVGHVGRYCYIKNQVFLLKIFKELLIEKPESVLLLVGKGEDEQKLRSFASELGIKEKVKFLIDRDDVDELYNAMDVFVMPSLFEGLPVVSVEAQANGLPCILSDNISEEAVLTSSVKMLSLNENAGLWANEILGTDIYRNPNATVQLVEKGYDIKIEAKKLEDWYGKLYREI